MFQLWNELGTAFVPLTSLVPELGSVSKSFMYCGVYLKINPGQPTKSVISNQIAIFSYAPFACRWSCILSAAFSIKIKQKGEQAVLQQVLTGTSAGIKRCVRVGCSLFLMKKRVPRDKSYCYCSRYITPKLIQPRQSIQSHVLFALRLWRAIRSPFLMSRTFLVAPRKAISKDLSKGRG